MTVGLSRWLRGFVCAVRFTSEQSSRAQPQRLDQLALSERDLADLNLPPHVAARLRAREAAADLLRTCGGA